MYKPSTHLVVSYFPTYRSDLLLTEWVAKVKPGSNSSKVHPQLSHDQHTVGGAGVGAS
jgi:hypothetical protein